MSPSRPWSFAALLALAGASAAEPADYVFVPYAEAGQMHIAVAAGDEALRGGGHERAQAISLGWTPVARWFTALYAGWYAEPGEHTAYDGWSWRNHVQLTTPGTGPAELGVLCDLARPQDRAEGTGITCGPTLQFDADHWQVNVNPLFEKYFHAEASAPAQFTLQWQAKTLLRPGWELGLQGFDAFGPWRHWLPAAQQEHQWGPAIFAKWPTADGQALRFDGALLVGVGAGSPKGTLRVRLQREF